jgi:hypothetical protein
MQIFGIFKNSSFDVQTSIAQLILHVNSSAIYISKSKLVLSECNAFYFIAIAFIAFTLHEIKQ